MVQVDELKKADAASLDMPILRPGAFYRPSDLLDSASSRRPKDQRVTRFLIANAFYEPENIGAWLIGPSGEITFKTNLAPGEPLIVYVSLFSTGLLTDCTIKAALDAPPGVDELRSIAISGGAFHTFASLLPSIQLQVRGHAGAEGVCHLTLDVVGDYPRPAGDDRDLGLGFSGLGYAAVSDIAARTDILEALTFKQATETGA